MGPTLLALLACLAAVITVGTAYLFRNKGASPSFAPLAQLLQPRKLKGDANAAIDITGALGLAFMIIGAIVGLLVTVALVPGVINGGANATQLIATSDFGDPTVNSLRPVFAMLTGLGVLSAVVGIIFTVIALRKD